MKRFVIQSILFIGLFALVIIPICAYNKAKLGKALMKEKFLPRDKTVLALGDSHVECSLDESFFPEMINKSKSSECYFFNFAKARYYCDFSEKLSVILIAYNYFSFKEGVFDFKLLKEQAQEFYPIYFPILISQSDLVERLASNYISTEFLQNYGVNKWGMPNKNIVNSFVHEDVLIDFMGGFLKEYVCKLTMDKVDEKIELHFKKYNDTSNFKLDGKMVEILNLLCDYSKERNIQLVFYNAPCHPEYNKRVPKDAIHKMDSLAGELQNKYNAIYLNYHDYPMPNDSCFRDYDHLNTRGAAIITPIVRDTLIKLGVIPDKEII